MRVRCIAVESWTAVAVRPTGRRAALTAADAQIENREVGVVAVRAWRAPPRHHAKLRILSPGHAHPMGASIRNVESAPLGRA